MICTQYLSPHNMQLGAELADYCKKLSKIADLLTEEELLDGRFFFLFFFLKLFAQCQSFIFVLWRNQTLKYTKEFREEKTENCRRTMSCIAGEKKDLLLKN